MLELQDEVLAELRRVTRSGLRRRRGPPERRQVDARQRDRRREGGGHLRQAADDAASDPRHRRTAMREGEPWQLVLVDLPGVQRPRDVLTERMQRRVERELAECDARPVRAQRRRADRRRRPVHREGARLGEAAGRGGGQQGGPARQRGDAPRRSTRRRGAGAGRRRRARDHSRSRRSRARASRPLRDGARRRCCPRARSTSRDEDVSDQPLSVRSRSWFASRRCAHARGGAALDRGAGRGGDRARRRPDRRAGGDLGRDRVPEGAS